jgi:hypothetical protein
VSFLFMRNTVYLTENFVVGTDAEECWTQMANALKEVPGIDASGNTIAGGRRFVDQFMMAEIRRE